MFHWYRVNRIGAVGVLACLLFCGVETYDLLDGSNLRTALNTPSGMLAQAVAVQFSEPPSLLRAGSARMELTRQLVSGAQIFAALLFTLLLWVRTSMRRPARLGQAALALQALLGVATMSALLYVLAAQLAVLLPPRQGRRWLAAQIALLAAVVLQIALFRHLDLADDTVMKMLIYAAIGMLLQAVTFGIARLAMREREARATLARSHATLLATQAMLADTVRSSERNRIARDLHDAVGHHLTALNLHLDLALRQVANAAPEALHTSRELARTLLNEVREVVNSERSDQDINLRAAIATMCAGIPAPAIRFSYDEQLVITSATLAHTLFYCTQEALTNALRHSGATLITIAINGDDEQVRLVVHDNGCGTQGAAEGNGLRGMRERVAEQCGTLQLGHAAGTGFGLAIALPLAGSYA